MIERQNEYGNWVPAEPMLEPFGVLWGRLWHERRRHGEPKWVALFTSWRDARAISRAASSQHGWWLHDCRLSVRELPPETNRCRHCGAASCQTGSDA